MGLMDHEVQMEGATSVWLLVLAPVAALAVLALFRFTGCGLLVSFDEYQTEPTYSSTVESDTPVAYWRLGEPHAAEPSSR